MILDAKIIDVSRIKLFSNSLGKVKESRGKMKHRGNSNRGYKLCICLPELHSKGRNVSPKIGREHLKSNQKSSEHNQHLNSTENDQLVGLVFAVKLNLDCSKFSSFVCKRASYSSSKLEKKKQSLE